MEQRLNISGMTCQGCVKSVTEKLSKVSGVEGVQVDLEAGTAAISSPVPINIGALRSALPEKYRISPVEDPIIQDTMGEEVSKWRQLRPLFLIFTYLFGASFLLNFNAWDWNAAMLDFMGLFYIVFSFFKFLDLKGFPESFRMYDPLAKLVPAYGWVYPFLELVLGLLFLMRIQVQLALVLTIVILGITTVGVTRTLLDKKAIRCACLGTALKLPMTEATFIENAIMLIMAIAMLVPLI
ncbi:MauE/DoxX family redox-associated membrane protein [Flagellimonas sp. DF-77]|uniref:heavy-metal-associated domain-containing protein n=1 Tax=Flagellimonas algarum TaxID=3230298 RepID=UPI0033910652